MVKKCPRFNLKMKWGSLASCTGDGEAPEHLAQPDPWLLGLGAHEGLTQKPSQPYKGDCGRV